MLLLEVFDEPPRGRATGIRWRDLKDWEEQEPRIPESESLDFVLAASLELKIGMFRSGSKKVTLKTDSRGPCWRQWKHGTSWY